MQSFFHPVAKQNSTSTGLVTLGNVSVEISLAKLPDRSGSFLYFKLNNQAALNIEGARLIAERIQELGLQNPYFITPEASTYVLAHELRRAGYEGDILYKDIQLNDEEKPYLVEYNGVTSANNKLLYLGRKQAEKMRDKDVILLDSVCNSGGTLRACHELLGKAGIKPVDTCVLFTEGTMHREIILLGNVIVKLHSFSHLPLIIEGEKSLKIGVVGSESSIKLKAIRNSLEETMPEYAWDILGVAVESGKPEQPFDAQTLEGAINRANEAKKRTRDYDFIIAIESGLFKQADGTYWDKAMMYCLTRDNQSCIYESESLEFDKDSVEEAIRRNKQRIDGQNMKEWTAGQIMQERGLVTDHKDPHASLTKGKKIRAEFIKETVVRLCTEVLLPQQKTQHRPKL